MTRSDSTNPIYYLNHKGLRLWSWELGDESGVEVVQSTLAELVNMTKLVIYCYTNQPQAVSINVTAVGLTTEVKDVSIELLANLPLGSQLTTITADMVVPNGLYAFKLSSRQQLFVVGLAYG